MTPAPVRVAKSADQATRSRMMATIKAKDTLPELQVRRFLHRQGYRYRLHHPDLPGRPDIVLVRWGVVVMINGCFWHGHQGCPYYKVPNTRRDFWLSKIGSNVLRDQRNAEALSNKGWRIAVIWECALRDGPDSALATLERFLHNAQVHIEIATDRCRGDG